MKIATWNVNGIRARAAQVREWIERERLDVVCLQEMKAAPEQIPADLAEALAGYWCAWHCERAYSGVALLVRKEICPEAPSVHHPPFDFECRIAEADVAGVRVASVYVPNGGKDFEAKRRFLASLADRASAARAAGTALVLCGDINVAHRDVDVHPKERKPTAIGQLPEERALFDRLLAEGLVDVTRALHPNDDQIFTWWAPWRNLRQRNIGWRIDYLLASEALAGRTTSCASFREVGTSDHAPLVAEIAMP